MTPNEKPEVRECTISLRSLHRTRFVPYAAPASFPAPHPTFPCAAPRLSMRCTPPFPTQHPIFPHAAPLLSPRSAPPFPAQRPIGAYVSFLFQFKIQNSKFKIQKSKIKIQKSKFKIQIIK